MRFLFITFLAVYFVQTDSPKITEIKDSDKKELIGSLLSGDSYSVEEFTIRIHKKENAYGSAGNESGEITHSYFFAISDNDDYPRRSVFEVGEFYKSNILSVRKKDNLIEVDVEYYSNRKKVTRTIIVKHHIVRFI